MSTSSSTRRRVQDTASEEHSSRRTLRDTRSAAIGILTGAAAYTSCALILSGLGVDTTLTSLLSLLPTLVVILNHFQLISLSRLFRVFAKTTHRSAGNDLVDPQAVPPGLSLRRLVRFVPARFISKRILINTIVELEGRLERTNERQREFEDYVARRLAALNPDTAHAVHLEFARTIDALAARVGLIEDLIERSGEAVHGGSSEYDSAAITYHMKDQDIIVPIAGTDPIPLLEVMYQFLLKMSPERRDEFLELTADMIAHLNKTPARRSRRAVPAE